MSDPYATLGVPPEADEAELKRAYRQAAQRAHPDKPGGSEKRFQEINAAYKLLRDPVRRARFDKTGDGAAPDARRDAEIKVIQSVLSLLNTPELDEAKVDLIATVRQAVQQTETNDRKALFELRASLRKRERALKRIRRKTPGENFIAVAIEHDLNDRRRRIALGEEALAEHLEAYKVLDNFAYDTDLHVQIGGIVWKTSGT